MPPFGYVTSPLNVGGGVYVVDAATNTVVGSPIYTHPAWGVAVTPDNTHVYFSTGGTSVFPYNITTSTLGAAIVLPANTYGLAILPDGSGLYVCCDDTNVYPISIPGNVVGAPITGIAGSFPFTGDINICITPDGTQAFVTDHNAVIQFYTATGVPTFAFASSPAAGIYGVAASPDGTQILGSGLINQIVVWSPISNSVVTRTNLATPGPTSGIAIQPSGVNAYTNSQNGSQGSSFVMASDTAGSLYNISTPPGGNVGANVGVSPDSSTVYFCDTSGALEAMSVPSNTLLPPLHSIQPQNIAFGPAVTPPPVVTFPKLFIPRKGFPKYEQRDYGINFRAIERWANGL